jgi:predicted nucleic acid-binding protein
VIFLDTNFLVRLLVDPVSPEDQAMMARAAQLMRLAMSGSRQVTTCDAVIAEVAFVLGGDLYRVPREEIASGLSRLMRLPGFIASQKSTWQRALEIWVERSTLSFVDALAAAYAIDGNHQLATFDKRLARYPGLSVYSPEAP